MLFSKLNCSNEFIYGKVKIINISFFILFPFFISQFLLDFLMKDCRKPFSSWVNLMMISIFPSLNFFLGKLAVFPYLWSQIFQPDVSVQKSIKRQGKNSNTSRVKIHNFLILSKKKLEPFQEIIQFSIFQHTKNCRNFYDFQIFFSCQILIKNHCCIYWICWEGLVKIWVRIAMERG